LARATIIGVTALIALLMWIAVETAHILDRRHEARATLLAHAEQQHAWVMAGDDHGVYGAGNVEMLHKVRAWQPSA
jgi:hypothetical protein